MNLRNFLDDDDAVSPVIGVILMVAITVILAAVIATFVLGLGEQVSETAPQASFTFDYDESEDASTVSSFGNDKSACGSCDGLLTITHAGGETINADELKISGASGATGAWSDSNDYAAGSEITAGDDLTVWVSSDDTVRVNWEDETGSSSSTIRKWTGPDA